MTESQVECYSGHTYAGEPRAITWQGRRLEVVAVERRWRTPDGPAYRVTVDGGLHFDLYYLEAARQWQMREHT